MNLAITIKEVEQILAENTFTHYYGFQVEKLGEGMCTLKVPFHEKLIWPGGYVNGPTLMAAADVAMWFAIMTKLGRTDMAVTTELNTAFLNGARREDVYCRAEILKMGRRLVFGTALCTNAEGRKLTHHSITYIRPEA